MPDRNDLVNVVGPRRGIHGNTDGPPFGRRRPSDRNVAADADECPRTQRLRDMCRSSISEKGLGR
jgi:hypothetical protein